MAFRILRRGGSPVIVRRADTSYAIKSCSRTIPWNDLAPLDCLFGNLTQVLADRARRQAINAFRRMRKLRRLVATALCLIVMAAPAALTLGATGSGASTPTAHRATPVSNSSSTISGGIDSIDSQSRALIAQQLQRLGVSVDWRERDLLALTDLENRVESARHLQQMGVSVDWRKHDDQTLNDMEMRVESARRLQHIGVTVDWRRYDLSTLTDMETLADAAERLKPLGVRVLWDLNSPAAWPKR